MKKTKWMIKKYILIALTLFMLSAELLTSYSVIYNNEKKTVEVWPFQNYFKSYKFDVKGKEQ